MVPSARVSLVRIVVTEGFDPVEGVKSLEQSADPVLKVHSLRRFQTGIYDYASLPPPSFP